MNYVAKTIKYLLFVFNLLFSLCGLAFLIYGVLVHVNLKNSLSDIQNTYPLLGIIIMVIGGITFVIAFCGSFGAILENRGLIITFRILLSIFLIVHIALSTYFFIVTSGIKLDDFAYGYKIMLNKYWEDSYIQTTVDAVQVFMHCCGSEGSDDFMTMPNSTGKYPWSCCPSKGVLNYEFCAASEVYRNRCDFFVYDTLTQTIKYNCYIIFGIAAVESIGILLSFFLAHAVENDKRRALEA